MIAEIVAVLGHPVEVECTESRPGDVPHSQASSELRSLLGPIEPVPLADGLCRTDGWIRSLG